MAKIYLSYQHTGKDIIRRISHELALRGHVTLRDETVMKVGQDWRKVLLDALKSADSVVSVNNRTKL